MRGLDAAQRITADARPDPILLVSAEEAEAAAYEEADARLATVARKQDLGPALRAAVSGTRPGRAARP